MSQTGVERRRGRRVTLEAPLLVRRTGTEKPESFKGAVTINVSIAGASFETEELFTANEPVIASVSVPQHERRRFPFVRLAGPSRVCRIEELPKRNADEAPRYRVALEFAEDVTILMAVPGHA